jgi:hypothetical protein
LRTHHGYRTGKRLNTDPALKAAAKVAAPKPAPKAAPTSPLTAIDANITAASQAAEKAFEEAQSSRLELAEAKRKTEEQRAEAIVQHQLR